MRVFFLMAVFSFFVGCSSMKPSITEYRIVVNNKDIKSDSKGCLDRSLKVSQAFGSSSSMSTKMDYTLLNNQSFSYTQAQWRDTPNRAISLEILKSIRDSGLFKHIQSSKTRSNSDLILETYVEDFMQYYSEDLKGSYVNVVVSFSLIDMKTNTIISTNTFRSKIKTKSLDALGGAEALNEALTQVMSQNIKWLGEVCR